MTTKDEALKMAIDFMKTLTIDVGIKTWNEKHRKEAIQTCKEALAQSAQDAQQETLSDEVIDRLVDEAFCNPRNPMTYRIYRRIARVIEKAHGIGA
jgi:hypothetical protein